MSDHLFSHYMPHILPSDACVDLDSQTQSHVLHISPYLKSIWRGKNGQVKAFESPFQKYEAYFSEINFLTSWKKKQRNHSCLSLKYTFTRVRKSLMGKCKDLMKRPLPPLVLLNPKKKKNEVQREKEIMLEEKLCQKIKLIDGRITYLMMVYGLKSFRGLWAPRACIFRS